MPPPDDGAWDSISGFLDDLAHRLGARDDGHLADYIPELARADPDHFGIAIATLDGTIYHAGDAAAPFTIQSMSKPFVLALVLEDLGLERLLERVGMEPSGDAFNAISLEPVTGRPANPMINAGAMLTTSLVRGPTSADRWRHIQAGLSAFAGRSLDVDEAVYRSEDGSGDRNRALAWLMRGAGSLRADVEPTVQAYFRQCSLQVTTGDLAVMAATLANGGVNPCTGTRVVSAQTAGHVLAVMATCGMYDGAGDWMLRVGMPAKSGVSGGLLAVLPAQFGIGLYSPPLDENGNSVRGVAACRELSERFGLHLMHPRGRWTTPIDRASSEDGGAILIRGLRGDIGFADGEAAVRAIMGDHGRALVLDMLRVGEVNPVAQQMLDSMLAELEVRAIPTVIVDDLQRAWFAGAHHEPTVQAAVTWARSRVR